MIDTAPEESRTTPTRERIKAIAVDLYVLHGYDGFSFGDIAGAIGTTRANIHHHFGNKQKLMAELIDGFSENAAWRIKHHWIEAEVSFAQRLSNQLEDLRIFYHRFNKKRGDRNVWSPLARLRLDLPVLGELATHALEKVNRSYETSLRQAIHKAVQSGEFSQATPVDDVARVLRVFLMSCAPMTQDTGSFDELEKMFGALGRTMSAWDAKASRRKRKIR